MQKGFVYIIQMLGTDYYKIGMTTQNNPMDRINCYNTYAPLGIKKVKIIESIYPNKLEKELHKDFKHKRKNGEWFELDKTDLKLIEDKYSVSNGKLLNVLEKLIHYYDSEELLYSVLKTVYQTNAQTNVKTVTETIEKDVKEIVEKNFGNDYFSSSQVANAYNEAYPERPELNSVIVGKVLTKWLKKFKKYINGASTVAYNKNFLRED